MPAPRSATRPRDAKATQERLLAAAAEEFGEHGLAGARIDRIAERAEANKRLIYVYFGNKDDLFDAVMGRAVGVMTDAVPFTAEDLAGWAGALFDHLVEDPQVLRLAQWRDFQRTGVADRERASYAAKVRAVAAAQKAGAVDGAIPAVDVLALVMSMVTSWLTAAAALREAAGADPLGARRLKQHRKALVLAVRRAFMAG